MYFGGDSSMEPVFGQTGHKYGPINLTLIRIGAYAPRNLLRSVHASPEEAVETGARPSKQVRYGAYIGERSSSHKKIHLNLHTDTVGRPPLEHSFTAFGRRNR